jgi:hypothetical protein
MLSLRNCESSIRGMSIIEILFAMSFLLTVLAISLSEQQKLMKILSSVSSLSHAWEDINIGKELLKEKLHALDPEDTVILQINLPTFSTPLEASCSKLTALTIGDYYTCSLTQTYSRQNEIVTSGEFHIW